jgi:hypothetical protein
MNIDPAFGDQLEARIRVADARLDELDAAARARNAQAEMDEISGLRKQRDRVCQHLADVKRSDSPSVQRELETEWHNLHDAIADAHGRYSAWDNARERRFNAHMDEIEASLRKSSARAAEGVADTRASIEAARNDLKTKLDKARRNFKAWREQQKDQAAVRTLSNAELELDESFESYAAAMDNVVRRATSPRAD